MNMEQTFAHWHKNPPAPFNPAFDPRSKDWRNQATASMEADGFYDTHTREECSVEWRRRYDKFKAEAK